MTICLPEHVAGAIQCGPVPKVRDWRKVAVKNLTRAERAMAFVERYLRVPEGDLIGQKIRLDIYQEAFFYAVLDNPATTRRAFLSIARKNAKTATIACLLLVFVCGPEARLNARVASGARSRDQAAEVYNYASKMVQLSPELSARCKIIPSKKCIIGLSKNVEYLAISADGRTAHGKSPLIAILDEVGQIRGPQDDFVDAIVTAQGAYDDAMLFALSTQAANDSDLFSQWIDDAAQSKDPRIVSHVYAAAPDADVLDQKAWQAANPALGKFRSLKDVQEQADRASRMPSFEPTFRNLILNQRVELTSPFVSRNIWQACNANVADFDNDTPLYAGLDLSARTDLTAFCLMGQIDGVWHVKPYFWTPENALSDRAKRDRAPYDVWVKQGFLRTTPGHTVDYEYVATEILDIIGGYNVQKIGYDRWRIDVLRKEFERLGADLPLIECGQGFKDMSPALDAMEAELLNQRVAHGGHPVLTMCAANAIVTTDPAGNRKLDKHKATGRIDGMVALAMAFFAAAGQEVDDDADFATFISSPLAVGI